MHDGLSSMNLNKRKQKSLLKDVAEINHEILEEESEQIM